MEKFFCRAVVQNLEQSLVCEEQEDMDVFLGVVESCEDRDEPRGFCIVAFRAVRSHPLKTLKTILCVCSLYASSYHGLIAGIKNCILVLPDYLYEN